MVEANEALSDADLAHLGALHVDSIEGSLPTHLGARYAARLYAYLARSDHEIVFVERVDGIPEAACIVSLDPQSLYGRIARSTFASLAPAALAAAFRSPGFRTFLRHWPAELVAGHEPPRSPEITFIFTNAQLRGRSLGKSLIGRVDRGLGARGVGLYYVKTLDEASNRALSFYDQNGFERIGIREEGGRRFVEFSRSLA